LFRGLDGARRALRLAVVDRIEEVRSARSGRRGPASGPARRGDPSACRSAAAELGDEKVRLFRLNDGAHEIGYAFKEVIDFATIEHDVIHAENRARSAAYR
jgi:two-component system chemotaxis sensor kinase CheA